MANYRGAKESHKNNLLAYLAIWDNPWPKSMKDVGEALGVHPNTIRKHFKVGEIDKIKNEGLELRKQNSSDQRASVYDAMLKEAKKGNTTAQNSFLDRTEGKISDKVELTGKDGGAIAITAMPLEPKTIAEWEKQQAEAAQQTIEGKK